MSKPIIAIFGAGTGISLGVARKFAQQGFAVALVARNEQKLQKIQKELQSGGFEAKYFLADAAFSQSIKDACSAIKKSMGNIEVMLYNASVQKRKSILDEDADSLISDFKVNVANALTVVKEVLPSMREAGKGCVMLTGGGFALYPNASFGSLSLGKASIRSLAGSLHQTLQHTGIMVGTVTVCGVVGPNDPKYNPASIAEQFWKIYSGEVKEAEIVY